MDIYLNMSFFPESITQELWWQVFIACLATFIVNLPFGYWRGGLRKFSFLWFLAIHAPVPFVILIRKLNHLQFSWTLVPFLVGSFFLGQFIGKKIYTWKPYKSDDKTI